MTHSCWVCGNTVTTDDPDEIAALVEFHALCKQGGDAMYWRLVTPQHRPA